VRMRGRALSGADAQLHVVRLHGQGVRAFGDAIKDLAGVIAEARDSVFQLGAPYSSTIRSTVGDRHEPIFILWDAFYAATRDGSTPLSLRTLRPSGCFALDANPCFVR